MTKALSPSDDKRVDSEAGVKRIVRERRRLYVEIIYLKRILDFCGTLPLIYQLAVANCHSPGRLLPVVVATTKLLLFSYRFSNTVRNRQKVRAHQFSLSLLPPFSH
jgi:hypothetical protein